MDNINLFTIDQGNMLIRLLLAHFVSDFVLQTKRMVDDKRWLSKYMFLHIAIVYLSTAIFTGWWLAAGIVAIIHYIIDGSKIEAIKRFPGPGLLLFLIDQAFHIISLLLVWAGGYGLWNQLGATSLLPFTNYNYSLLLLGYLIVIGPVGYIIKFATHDMVKSLSPAEVTEHGGRRIGIFERIIILTFVLLGRYEAIGFLLAGKSIIRFMNKDEHLRSEYVLIGTMMSYALSIMVGVAIHFLLKN
jgi:hypothetical protein